MVPDNPTDSALAEANADIMVKVGVGQLASKIAEIEQVDFRVSVAC
jgi:hypothetical protein